ncbi:hypothetical protein BGZ93_011029 [Podila epicladia]|nr:hypothetical protein BGZ93_011029 [Podila epicladia]
MIASPKIALHYSDVSSTDMSKAVSDSNKSFTLVYCEMVSVGGTARDMLAFSKKLEEVLLAEAMVIDVYLAEEFGLLVDNIYEELTIKAFNSSSHFLMERFSRLLASAAERKRNMETFIDIFLPKFICDHEFHPRNNGKNGHYVGSRIFFPIVLAISPIGSSPFPNSGASTLLFSALAGRHSSGERRSFIPDYALWQENR